MVLLLLLKQQDVLLVSSLVDFSFDSYVYHVYDLCNMCMHATKEKERKENYQSEGGSRRLSEDEKCR